MNIPMSDSESQGFGAPARRVDPRPNQRWASVRIGRIDGTPVTVDVGAAILASLFIVVLAVEGFVRVAPASSLASRLVVSSATVTLFLASIVAHELGHAAMAKRFDIKVLGVTLSLLGGYTQLDRQAPTPRAEFAIAAAGPAVNLGLGALLGAAVVGLNVAEIGSTTAGSFLTAACFWLAAVNLTLAVLNLAPASPLDGGRILTAWLWHRSGDAEMARIQSGRIGLGLGVTLTAVGLLQTMTGSFGGVVTVVVGVFLFQGARREIQGATLRRRLASTTVSELMVAHPNPIPESLPLDRLPQLVSSGQGGLGLPVSRWGGEAIGFVLASVVEGHSPEHSWTTVGAVMQPADKVARAWTTEPLDAVLPRCADYRELLVVAHEPQAGVEVGTITNYQLRDILRPPDTWGRPRSA